MNKMLLALIAMFIVVAVLQATDWDNTELSELSQTRVQKFLTTRSLFVDEYNRLHVIYLQTGAGGTVLDRELYYTMRNSENEWSRPQLIEAAGNRFANPSIVVLPESGEVNIYGDIAGILHRVSRNEAGEWEFERVVLGNNPIYMVNAALDASGNTHIAGVTYDLNEQTKIIYYTDINGEWEYYVAQQSIPNLTPQAAQPYITANERGRIVVAYLGMEGVYVLQNRAPGQDVWQNRLVRTPMERDYFSAVQVTGELLHLVVAGQDMWGSPWRQFYFVRHFEDEEWRQPVLVNDNTSVNSQTMAVDRRGGIHLVGTEISGNVNTGALKYITNANPEGRWQISNPFGDHRWTSPQLALDYRDNFQFLAVKTVHIQGNEYHHEVVHIGAPWQLVLFPPGELTAAADSVDVVLRWNSPDFGMLPQPDILGYNAYRRHSEQDSFSLINEESITDTTYTDLDLEPGVYEYYVTAMYDGDEESSQSNIVRVRVKAILPPPSVDPPAGVYDKIIYIELTCEEESASIYYTMDGSEPDEEALLYEEKIFLDESVMLKAKAYHPDFHPSAVITAEYVVNPTKAEVTPEMVKTGLYPPYPNPFNPETRIAFALSEPSPVTLAVYNVRGQVIKYLLREEKLQSGRYAVVWDGKDELQREQASGLYFITFAAGDVADVKMVILLK